MSLLGVLTIVFVIAKLAGVIDWSWWLVFAPVYAPIIIWVIAWLMSVILGAVFALLGHPITSVRSKKSNFRW